ncbi:MAG: RagB/SusD family nutrient uptake outer membrane protein [Chitinophagaceae bacterium]
MKKIQKVSWPLFFFIAGCFMLFTSCKKQLETKVYSSLTPDNFYQSEGDANAALMTLYIPFTSYWGNPDPGTGTAQTWYAALYNADIKSYLSKSLISTDEIYNEGGGANTADLFNFTFGPDTWQGTNDAVYYKISYVAKATEVIAAIGKSAVLSDAIKKSYIAQAKALRAWTMFVLYDFYGPLNPKTDFATLTDTAAMPRLAKADYIALIEKDVNEALPDLTDKYNSDAANWGRVGKGLARMVLLKLYMQEKQWVKAEAIARQLMTMGYSLMTGPLGYRDVFRAKANKELIYAVPANAASANWWSQEVFPLDFKAAPDFTYASDVPGTGIANRASGWLTQYMPWAYYDKYDAADIRRNTTILDHYTNTANAVKNRGNGMKGAVPLKYTLIPLAGDAQPIDVVVYRYADVLLSLAEAINEQGTPTAEAYSLVNQVRARAGVPDFTAGMTQAQFRTALLDERGREFYGEGVRRQDLIRNGTYISNAVARGKTAAQPHMILYPIPRAVLTQSRGVITQNPGYPQ